MLAVLLVGCGYFAFPQAHYHLRPRLGILPFAGGVGGDGYTIAALLSARHEILGAFTLVPIAGDAGAVIAEQLFQMGAFTDSDVIADIGHMLGVDYVISGHIRQVRNRNLVIATVVRVETFELVAGYHRMYRSIWEAGGFVPDMARNLADATLMRPALGRLSSLAIAPAILPLDDQGDPNDAPGLLYEADVYCYIETFALVLAIEIANSGEYAVLPRASYMQTAFGRWLASRVDERAAALERLLDMIAFVMDDAEGRHVEVEVIGAFTAMGRAVNADFVLSIDTRALGGVNTFSAQILHTESEDLFAGVSRGYRDAVGGVNLMTEIAILLTDPEGAPNRVAAFNRQRRLAVMFDDPARFWSLGIFGGTSFADPWAIGGVQATLAPFPFSFVRLGFEAGFITDIPGADFFSMYPFAHLVFFMPFALRPIPLRGGGWYIGLGGGFTMARYNFYTIYEDIRAFMVDFTAGVNIGNVLGISYTLRTDFSTFNSKASIGYTFRFRVRGR